ncbi:carboxylesterase/lipase family protein [Williamsia herbipolensis]|uniref:Carboxylic ester hydrolase n=1 Tax=Williamsia herbipolensis TaxID=1603258 RepID=A0AAU4K4G4_9NOCA|nr:carboxylesterase/lipase family protein [Williamsia herbipolensis]
MSDDTVVMTDSGPVRGSVTHTEPTDTEPTATIRSWKGVRYAAPPVGDLRWRAPQPPTPWTEPADATRFGAAAPQPTLPFFDLGDGVTLDEDCLFLNIWAADTDTDTPRPVMVWVHGGAYVLGAASQPMYDGTSLAASGEVIVVTVNYRLGALGFLDLTSFDAADHRFESNLALRDVIAALRWVRENIAAFGGDPDQVTLFGESAGGGMVTTLMTVPAAEGLFHRAIAQSSPATSVYDSTRARGIAEKFLENIEVSPDALTDLLSIPADRIAQVGNALFDATPKSSPGTLAFAPVVDRDLVPDYPVTAFRDHRAHPVPLMIGTNKDEAALFRLMRSPLIPITRDSIRSMFAQIARERPDLPLPTEEVVLEAYADVRAKGRGEAVARDIGFRMPTVWLADGHSQIAPVFLYRFDWATTILRLFRIGATHATELPYVFGTLTSGWKDITFKLGGRATGEAVSRRMQRRWIGFAVSGTPDGLDGDPAWPSYGDDRATLVIDSTDDVVVDLDRAIRSAWGDEVLSFT